MAFDYHTIYVMVAFNRVTLILIWLFMARSYPEFGVARIWLSASIFTAAGGVIIALGGGPQAGAAVFVGTGVEVSGFGLSWCGVRAIYGRHRPYDLALAWGLLCGIGAAVLRDAQYGRHVVYALGQSLPLALSMTELLLPGRRKAGARLAAGGMGAAIFTHLVMVLAGDRLHAGQLDAMRYLQLEAAAIVATVFFGIVWNFGFVLMAVDRLRADLARLAIRDEMTGLANRRHFDDRLRQMGALARRTRRGFSVMLIDIDRFKHINDTYGHAMGDKCLKHFADHMAAALRDADLLARRGGDEFCVMLPDTAAGQARELARRLAAVMRQYPVVLKGAPHFITMSIGIAEWSPDVVDLETLVGRADQALYQVKRRGRDGVAIADGHCGEAYPSDMTHRLEAIALGPVEPFDDAHALALAWAVAEAQARPGEPAGITAPGFLPASGGAGSGAFGTG